MDRYQLLIKSFLLLLSTIFLTECTSTLVTAANLIYDRHHVYKKINDFKLVADARRVLYKDQYFKCKNCVLDFAAFNGCLLLAGHLPTKKLRDLAFQRIKDQGGYEKFFNQVAIQAIEKSDFDDDWISTKIRARILADASIDPNTFKIITVDKIVYIMGDVHFVQGKKILQLASSTSGVKRIVSLLRYYLLTK